MGSRAGARVLRRWHGGAAFVALAAVALLLLALGLEVVTHEAMASAAPRPPPPNALPVIGGCIPPNTYRTSRTFNISGHLVRVEITLTIAEAVGGFQVTANVTLAPVSGAAEVFFTPPLADMAVKTDLGTYVWSHGKFFIQVVLRKKLPVSTRMSLRVNGTCIEGVALYIRPIRRYVVLGSSVVTRELVEALSRAIPQGATHTPVIRPVHTPVTPKRAGSVGETLVIYVIYSSNGSAHIMRGVGRLVSEVGNNASVRICINGTCLTSTLTSKDGVVSLEGGLASMLKNLISGGKVLAVAVLKPDALKALPQLLNLVEASSSSEIGGLPHHSTTVSVCVRPQSTATAARSAETGATATPTAPSPKTETVTTATVSTVTRSVPTSPVVKTVPTTTQQHVTHTHTTTATTASRLSAVRRPPVGRVEWLATAVAAAIAVGVGVIAYLAMRWRP